MDLAYTSVTKFFIDLKAFLLANGLTVVRALGEHDVVLDSGSGFMRLQKKTISPTVVAVGWEFGADPDLLIVSTTDPERVFPFEVVPGAEFHSNFHWYAPTKTMHFFLVSGSKRYRVDSSVVNKTTMLLHEDRFHTEYQPNFKDTGGPYISAGA